MFALRAGLASLAHAKGVSSHMNFSSYQKQLIQTIESALTEDKDNLIHQFKSALYEATSLYRTNEFDFWIAQLEQNVCGEIPITNYGLCIAKSWSKHLINSKRNEVPNILRHMCVYLFTYCSDSDMGPEQEDYHYYFSFNENIVYKDCGLDINPRINRPLNGEYRIALKSELDKDESEYL